MSPARRLLEQALACDALLFGDFHLKSGRPSPYFMNFGRITTGTAAALLGELYAKEAMRIAPGGALLLGLPYKGVALAALAAAVATNSGAPGFDYAYLRKESKGHGEGGDLVGTVPDDGRPIVLIDDVLTVGATAIESVGKLAAMGIRAQHLIIGFDRQEISDDERRSAQEELAEDHGIELATIATAVDLLEVATAEQAEVVATHLRRYGNAAAQAGLAAATNQ